MKAIQVYANLDNFAAAGLEPTTFQSRIEHANHSATKTGAHSQEILYYNWLIMNQ